MNKKLETDYSLFDKLPYPILVISDRYDVIFLNASAKNEYLSDIPDNKRNIKDLKDKKYYKISHSYDKPCYEKSFSKPNFMKKVLSACYNVGGSLTIEITERVLVEDIKKTKFIINGLKNCKAEFGEEGICENPIKMLWTISARDTLLCYTLKTFP